MGRKGANEVASLLMAFFNSLPAEVTHLRLFCDSCPGQNKNWTVFRTLHYMVVHQRRFKEITLHFPVRGHSYMECDRDMVPVNQKLPLETPAAWREHFRDARRNPSPFNAGMLVPVDKSIRNFYYAACPFKVIAVREAIFSCEHPRLIRYRENWNGPFSPAVVAKPAAKGKRIVRSPLEPVSNAPLPIKNKKCYDLLHIKKFCVAEESKPYFSSLSYVGQEDNNDDDNSELSEDYASDEE